MVKIHTDKDKSAPQLNKGPRNILKVHYKVSDVGVKAEIGILITHKIVIGVLITHKIFKFLLSSLEKNP